MAKNIFFIFINYKDKYNCYKDGAYYFFGNIYIAATILFYKDVAYNFLQAIYLLLIFYFIKMAVTIKQMTNLLFK